MLLNIIQGLACAYVLCMSLLVLNRMSHKTSHTIRGAYLLIVLGTGLGVMGCLNNATYASAAISLGVAIFMLANRRRHFHAY